MGSIYSDFEYSIGTSLLILSMANLAMGRQRGSAQGLALGLLSCG